MKVGDDKAKSSSAAATAGPASLPTKVDAGQIHFQNFIDTMRRGRSRAAPLEEGHLSTSLCHLGNIACGSGDRRKPTARRAVRRDSSDACRRTYRAPCALDGRKPSRPLLPALAGRMPPGLDFRLGGATNLSAGAAGVRFPHEQTPSSPRGRGAGAGCAGGYRRPYQAFRQRRMKLVSPLVHDEGEEIDDPDGFIDLASTYDLDAVSTSYFPRPRDPRVLRTLRRHASLWAWRFRRRCATPSPPGPQLDKEIDHVKRWVDRRRNTLPPSAFSPAICRKARRSRTRDAGASTRFTGRVNTPPPRDLPGARESRRHRVDLVSCWRSFVIKSDWFGVNPTPAVWAPIPTGCTAPYAVSCRSGRDVTRRKSSAPIRVIISCFVTSATRAGGRARARAAESGDDRVRALQQPQADRTSRYGAGGLPDPAAVMD